jgi:hypothetical protein
MGRHSTGAITVDAAQRIEMSYLIKRGYFSCFGKDYGSHTQSLSWTDNSSIGVETIHKPNETYLRLYYTITDNRTGEKTQMDYKVRIEYKPSNLGKGYVLYFRCPVSFKRCRILYRAYGSQYFKARGAYQNRLYYEAQKSSKKYQLLERFNTVRWKVESIWDKKGRKQTTFKGKPTKNNLKYNALIDKYDRLDELSNAYLMANLYRK